MSQTSQTERTYTSRWANPELPSNVNVTITPRHIELFKLLLRYKGLPTKHIVAHIGGKLGATQTYLRKLRRARYLECDLKQKRHDTARSHDQVYSLGPKGLDALINRGMVCELPVSNGGFPHQLMIDEIMSSFELGTRTPPMEMVRWEDILDEDTLPNKTREAPNPFSLPVKVKVDGELVLRHLIPDGQPFRIRRLGAESAKSFFCPGIEADQGTERVGTRDFKASSIYKKFLLYLAADEQGVFQTHYGRARAYIPFITGSPVRMQNMKKHLLAMTNGEGSRYILFKSHPTFYSEYEKQRPPSGHMIEEDWERAGYANFNFLSS